MYVRIKDEWFKYKNFMLIDLICLNFSFLIAFLLRFSLKEYPIYNNIYSPFLIVVNCLEILASLISSNLTDVLKRGPFAELVKVCILSSVLLLLTTLYMFSAHNASAFSRLLVYYMFFAFIVIDFFARQLLKLLIQKNIRNHNIKKKAERAVFVVTEKKFAAEILKNISENYYEHYSVNGVSIIDSFPCGDSDNKTVEIYDAAQYVCREWVDEVFVYLEKRTEEVESFLQACREMGVTVHTVLGMKDAEHSKQFIETLGDKNVLTIAYNYVTPHQAFVKRAFDIIGGLLGSILAVVIGIIIGPMIYFSSPGPILFKQVRIGQNGKKFFVYKFRSMYLDAEEKKRDLEGKNRIPDGMMFKLDFDPRIIGNRVLSDGTKKKGIGEFIRKTSLDEFPQFFNVLKGDMSIVGTRPPTEDEWEKYAYHHRARLAIRPGITGLWQVSGRSEITDFEEVVRLDTEYITKFRIALDVKIILKTFLVVFQNKGAL